LPLTIIASAVFICEELRSLIEHNSLESMATPLIVIPSEAALRAADEESVYRIANPYQF
jgi:hypothetical protein